MFGPAGFSYVYLIYGMYHCLNIVTENEDFPAAVLIRGLKMIDGSQLHLDGPGKICRHLGITKDQNAFNITKSNELYVACNNQSLSFIKTPRVGIKVGTDKPWRFLAQLT
jgi:DNA-3-methyladenine glycosylase